MIGTLLGTTEIVASIAPPLRKQQFKKLLKTFFKRKNVALGCQDHQKDWGGKQPWGKVLTKMAPWVVPVYVLQRPEGQLFLVCNLLLRRTINKVTILDFEH